MQIETLIQKLEIEQATLAHSALAQPAERDSFEYGRVCGLYAGVAHAVDFIKNAHAEDRRSERS